MYSNKVHPSHDHCSERNFGSNQEQICCRWYFSQLKWGRFVTDSTYLPGLRVFVFCCNVIHHWIDCKLYSKTQKHSSWVVAPCGAQRSCPCARRRCSWPSGRTWRTPACLSKGKPAFRPPAFCPLALCPPAFCPLGALPPGVLPPAPGVLPPLEIYFAPSANIISQVLLLVWGLCFAPWNISLCAFC